MDINHAEHSKLLFCDETLQTINSRAFVEGKYMIVLLKYYGLLLQRMAFSVESNALL